MGPKKPFDVYGHFAEFYDIYVGDRQVDVPFYLEYSTGLRTPALEIGAGSGRLTIPLARAGRSIVAVDVSASMLAILKSRLAQEPAEVQERVRVVEADACALHLGHRYGLIMVTFDVFNYFLTPEVQKAALERLALHLAPQGRIVIDVFLPLKRIEQCPAEPVLKVDTLDRLTGNKVRGWNVYSIDKDRQIETRQVIFEMTTPDGKVSKKEFTIERRYFYPSELKTLFLDNGFSVEAVFKDYDKKEPEADSEQLQYVLRRSADR